MPFIEANQLRKRHGPVWALVLAFVVLPPLGLFGWSCYRPVLIGGPGRGVSFERSAIDVRPYATHRGLGYLRIRPTYEWWAFKLPGGPNTGWYGLAWVWE